MSRQVLIDSNNVAINVVVCDENNIYVPDEGLRLIESPGEIGQIWNGSTFVNPPAPVYTEEDIIAVQELRILDAFKYMETKLEAATVQVPISSANNANRPFGCDQTTQDNIVGVNVAIAVNIPVSDPTYWTPKGYPFPILVTHAELANIGGAILNKKNELYQVYFTHKAAIMMTSDYNEIMTYNVTTGYD